MKPPQAPVHLPQCPTCGLPMSLSRIEPDPDPTLALDQRTYECVQGHTFVKAVERSG